MAEANFENRTLYQGDNLEFLRGMNSETVHLIATDPPFNKGVKAFEGITVAGKHVSYSDVWTWGDVQEDWTQSIQRDHPNLYAVIRAANAAAGEDMGAFLCWLGVRVLEMHRILKPTGSLYLHIDHTAHAWAKAMMDGIFGRGNFRNEIVWAYTGPSNTKRWFPRKHDTILWYAKGDTWTFNRDAVRVPYKQLNVQHREPGGGGIGGNLTSETVEDYREKGKIPEDYWLEDRDGMTPVGRVKNERTGYPTQKPLALYERIIRASSNEGDLVLDPFAGCATTCVGAERLGRQWVGIDINNEAEQVTLDRLKREVDAGLNWERKVSMFKAPPTRTDDGKEAAPELTLVSPRPKAPRLTARQLREKLIVEDGKICQACGWEPHLDEYLESDHRLPKSRGGRDEMRNRVLLCSPCNSAKGNRLSLPELRLRWIEQDRMFDKSWDMAWYERQGKFA